MNRVPDEVLKMHMFKHIGVLDMVHLSGVSRRFHRLLKHVSEEWSNLLIEDRLECAVRRGELQLLANIYSQQLFSIELERKCFYIACKRNYWDIIVFLKSQIPLDRNYIKIGFGKLCEYKHLDTASRFLHKDWILEKEAFYIAAGNYNYSWKNWYTILSLKSRDE